MEDTVAEDKTWNSKLFLRQTLVWTCLALATILIPYLFLGIEPNKPFRFAVCVYLTSSSSYGLCLQKNLKPPTNIRVTWSWWSLPVLTGAIANLFTSNKASLWINMILAFMVLARAIFFLRLVSQRSAAPSIEGDSATKLLV